MTAFFQMTDALGTDGKISTNVTTAQPTIAFGKGWGDFDFQSTVSVQIPDDALNVPNGSSARNEYKELRRPYTLEHRFPVSSV